PIALGPLLRHRALRRQAERLITQFKVRPPAPEAPMTTLSGGNVQRAVLARELSEEVSVLVAANPVFGLDFAAVAEIHARILAARDRGAAVLLVSEDLDELLALSDRIVVMFGGRLGHETAAATADVAALGPRATALVVIDMQRDFIEPGGFGAALGNDVSRLGAIVPTVRALLDWARAHGIPVI